MKFTEYSFIFNKIKKRQEITFALMATVVLTAPKKLR